MSNSQQRDISGKFTAKSLEYREVRSIRLTDKVWKILGNIAQKRSITRADLIEELVERGVFDSLAQPPNEELQLLIEQQKEKINELHGKISNLEEKLTEKIPYSIEDLADIRDRILFSLKLGKQNSIYKEVKKQLNVFVAELEKISKF